MLEYKESYERTGIYEVLNKESEEGIATYHRKRENQRK